MKYYKQEHEPMFEVIQFREQQLAKFKEAEKELEKQRYSNAIAWVGDKASLKHSFNALLNVEVGDEDFTTAD